MFWLMFALIVLHVHVRDGDGRVSVDSWSFLRADENLTNCAGRVFAAYYHNFSVFTYSANEDLVTDLLRNGTGKFTVVNLAEDLAVLRQFQLKHYFYVFVLRNAEEFQTFFSAAYRTRGWNPRANIFIVYAGQSDSDSDNIDVLFKIAWKYYSVNVSVLTLDLNIYTYFPISHANCGRNITRTFVCNCRNDSLDVFPKKLGLSFYNCPIKILPLVIQPYILDLHRERNPGYELVMLREICKHLNLTITYVDHSYKHWGTKLSDGSYTDMYTMLYDMKAEMIIGMILANESYAEDFEDTYPHSEVDLTFHVPTPLVVEGWKNFIIIFSSELWYSFGAAMVSCTLTWWLIGKHLEDSEGFDNLGNCAFKVWCVIFSCFTLQPKSGLIRFMYLNWTVYSFLMISTYTSVLIGFLTRPSYEKDIATTADMVNSDLHYGGLYVIRYVFDEPNNPTYQTLYKRFENCALAMGCTNRTAFQRDFGVIKNARQVAYFVPYVYMYPNGRPRIKRVKDTVVPQNLWTNTVKGFLYMERFNDAILRLREGGLIFKWDYEATNTWKNSIEEPPSVIPLTFSHLKFGFFCLLFGLLAAIVAFLHEIRVYRRIKRQFARFACFY